MASKKKKEIIIDSNPCSKGCKPENYKFSKIVIIEHVDRKSIKLIYECVICGKKH